MGHSRVFSVPLDRQAQEALDRDEASQDQLIERKITNEEFKYLFESGLLEKINSECDCNIGDYESEEITGLASLRKLRDILSTEDSKGAFESLFEDLLKLSNEAIDRETGVYIFF